MKRVKERYRFMCDVIESGKSQLTKELLLDNIFTIVTTHDNEVSNVFWGNGQIGKKSANAQPGFGAKARRISGGIHLFLRILMKPKAIWRRVPNRGKGMLLIYVPHPIYLDLGVAIYERAEKDLNLYPIIICESAGRTKHFEGYTQINMPHYSPGLRAFYGILKKIWRTKVAVKREERHREFYSFVWSRVWAGQVVNLVNKQILRNLFSNAKNIKAVFSCIPTTSFGRLLNITAQEFDIPTFSTKKGLTGSNVENYFVETDYLFAKGEQERDVFTNAGLTDKCSIAVVGAPYLQSSKIDKTHRNKGGNQLTILFIDFPLGQACSLKTKRTIVNMLGRVAKSIGGLYVLVKLHQETKHINIYDEEFQELGFCDYRVLAARCDVDTAIVKADYVLMFNSTVGFNVLLIMKKPLIVLGDTFYDTEAEDKFLCNDNIAYTVECEQELRDIFSQAVSGSLPAKNDLAIAAYLKHYIEDIGASATRNIMAFMKEILVR